MIQEIKERAVKKRPLSDTLLLWGTGCLVAALGVGYFLTADTLHVSKKLQLYLAFNVSFCLWVLWRFRSWLLHRGLRLLLPVWLVGHFLTYGFLAYLNVSFLFYLFLFPAEATVMRYVELRRAAIRRMRERESL